MRNRVIKIWIGGSILVMLSMSYYILDIYRNGSTSYMTSMKRLFTIVESTTNSVNYTKWEIDRTTLPEPESVQDLESESEMSSIELDIKKPNIVLIPNQKKNRTYSKFKVKRDIDREVSVLIADAACDMSKDRVMLFAKSKIGEPYRYGAARDILDQEEWDCSLFMSKAFRQADIYIGDCVATQIANNVSLVDVDPKDRKPRDIITMMYPKKGGGTSYHVTMILEVGKTMNDDVIIHASSGKGNHKVAVTGNYDLDGTYSKKKGYSFKIRRAKKPDDLVTATASLNSKLTFIAEVLEKTNLIKNKSLIAVLKSIPPDNSYLRQVMFESRNVSNALSVTKTFKGFCQCGDSLAKKRLTQLSYSTSLWKGENTDPDLQVKICMKQFKEVQSNELGVITIDQYGPHQCGPSGYRILLAFLRGETDFIREDVLRNLYNNLSPYARMELGDFKYNRKGKIYFKLRDRELKNKKYHKRIARLWVLRTWYFLSFMEFEEPRKAVIGKDGKTTYIPLNLPTFNKHVGYKKPLDFSNGYK